MKTNATNLIIALAALGAARCGVPTAEEQLSLPNGGLDTSDEPAMFGEQAAFLEAGEAEADPAVEPPATSPAGPVYYLALAAGRLREGAAVDVSGSLTASRGSITVLRKVRLGPADQVMPRNDPKVLEWNVNTTYAAGLLVQVIDDPAAGVPGTITLRAAGIDVTIPIEQLSALARVEKLPSGVKLAAAASVVDPTDDSAGFCGLRYKADADESGSFRGKWIDQKGALSGHLKGVFGVVDGRRVFAGKYIGANGAFKGLLRGTFDERGFRGEIVDANEQVIGTLEGLHDTHGLGVCRWDVN